MWYIRIVYCIFMKLRTYLKMTYKILNMQHKIL
jgi:hypothetical protein